MFIFLNKFVIFKNNAYICIDINLKIMKMTKKYYANGVEITKENSLKGKELLLNMYRFRGKLNNYGDWTEKKANDGSRKIIETFEQEGYEFFVCTYEAMDFDFTQMKMSDKYTHTEVRWQVKK